METIAACITSVEEKHVNKAAEIRKAIVEPAQITKALGKGTEGGGAVRGSAQLARHRQGTGKG
jgi:hypothetical protein